MTATATPKAARTLSVRWSARPLDKLVISVAVEQGDVTDEYHVFHADDSLEVEWNHDGDEERSYTVTCSGATGEPLRCTCPHWAHRRKDCRHLSATRVLIARGRLKLPHLTDAGDDRPGQG